MIKNLIKKSFWGRYLISELHYIESKIFPIFLSDEKAVKRFYRKKTGKELNLQEPHSFAEKLNWYKLNAKNPLMQKCADKYAVREYIKECGFEDLLNELYGVYEKVEEINLNELPERFVLKAAHGSHMNIVVQDKKEVNWLHAKKLMKSWLKQDIYWSGREWVYKNMPKRIIAEKYLEDETGELRDYKFFCFNGKPEFLQFDSGRLSGTHYRNYYDMEYNLLDITDNSSKINPSLVPTNRENFERMKEIASILAQPFQFVRTDFYVIGDKVFFGELTFFDGGGYSGFASEKDDYIFGEKWKIEYHNY